MQRIFYGVQIVMKLLFCYIEHLDYLRLGHVKRLMSWFGLYLGGDVPLCYRRSL